MVRADGPRRSRSRPATSVPMSPTTWVAIRAGFSRVSRAARSSSSTSQVSDPFAFRCPRSGGGCYELAELLGWCHPAERLARTFVELGADGVELSFGDGAEVEATRQVLAQQPDGVLVGAELPGRVGGAEVDGHVGDQARASAHPRAGRGRVARSRPPVSAVVNVHRQSIPSRTAASPRPRRPSRSRRRSRGRSVRAGPGQDRATTPTAPDAPDLLSHDGELRHPHAHRRPRHRDRRRDWTLFQPRGLQLQRPTDRRGPVAGQHRRRQQHMRDPGIPDSDPSRRRTRRRVRRPT